MISLGAVPCEDFDFEEARQVYDLSSIVYQGRRCLDQSVRFISLKGNSIEHTTLIFGPGMYLLFDIIFYGLLPDPKKCPREELEVAFKRRQIVYTHDFEKDTESPWSRRLAIRLKR